MGNFNFEIPDEIHKKFKIISIREEKDMRDILNELLVKYLAKKEGQKMSWVMSFECDPKVIQQRRKAYWDMKKKEEQEKLINHIECINI